MLASAASQVRPFNRADFLQPDRARSLTQIKHLFDSSFLGTLLARNQAKIRRERRRHRIMRKRAAPRTGVAERRSAEIDPERHKRHYRYALKDSSHGFGTVRIAKAAGHQPPGAA